MNQNSEIGFSKAHQPVDINNCDREQLFYVTLVTSAGGQEL